MKKTAAVLLITAIIFMTLGACRHVDSAAQAAAEAELIDRGTANFISLSARALGDAAEDITPEQEYYIGRAVAANILSVYKLWEGSRELTNYLNLICAAIVMNSPQPDLFNGYQVAILDSREINAFATSGGHIFITRSLINAAKSEDSLAGVIAHEVAHIQLRHGIKSIKTSRMSEALLLTAAAGIGNAKGMDVNEMTDVMNETVSEITQTMVNSGYSREQEYEADIAAMYLMALAGYEPSGFIKMLSELKDVQTTSLGFGKTHPSPRQRIYFAQKALKRFEAGSDNTAADRQARFNEALRLMVTR